MKTACIAASLCLTLAALPVSAGGLTTAALAAQLPPLPAPTVAPGAYQADDGGGFRDILPSGTRGRYSLPELAAFLATGTTVPHCCDQLPMYDGLNRAVPGLTSADIPKYFKEASFGVPAGGAERIYSPRADVTIVRDKAFGVPHVYGRTRSGDAHHRFRGQCLPIEVLEKENTWTPTPGDQTPPGSQTLRAERTSITARPTRAPGTGS